MLYRANEKKLSQNFAFIIDKKVEGGYQIISKNFFTCDDTFEVFGKNHDLITDIKIKKIIDVETNSETDRVNKPMYKYIISTTTPNLEPGDIGRISK
ncbi:MAG: U32 family peptidase C-terminal domain-containing protein [Mycoplasmoidaceae bacterium]|nr:U32 family peptidase C-terminal domain-containing protein [Mycoplasmoidaceae bacterium]